MDELSKIIENINRTVKALPTRVATLAVNFSKERFVQKNWHDIQPVAWTKTKKKKGSTLVASGRLKRSIRKISISPHRVVIGTNVPYAQTHNDGGEISGVENVKAFERKQHRRKAYTTRKGKLIQTTTVKSHTVKSFSRKYHRKFKKRQFIGKSEELNHRIEKLIRNELNKAIGDI